MQQGGGEKSQSIRRGGTEHTDPVDEVEWLDEDDDNEVVQTGLRQQPSGQ